MVIILKLERGKRNPEIKIFVRLKIANGIGSLHVQSKYYRPEDCKQIFL